MIQKKFGTFGGVFTPSILTILGVIMYMRLPWIVGQAGLLLTIGIILVAHLVSITTGLSVSSIATDKKVKAGGTYYIISRSLGLPIGGTLGIALFFGLSLSVSLYLIGFSESFLAFFNLPINKDTIRIAGTIALICVGVLTFISTSLAIKTQYFIMTAIFLSLITILFGSHEYTPAEPLMNPIDDSAPLILLFAIFFPAVTGFEAGVSMSGDLEDPKKSIPVGTITAIVVGLLVYIGLAAFFAYTVSADQLVNNPNILLDISFYPPLLVAGIWGATISSAIGSILGAPRILQAVSLDSITPKIFGKGYGPTNEPRNALLLTFIIAEIGILIGELNLIARVVSMFFITTYGFLNISSTIEKLASTDFRPSFSIPAWISIIGAMVSIILMLELDFVALIGAIVIMGAIFLYLKNRELTLESGDTWEGVWSSVLRTGLNRLNRTELKQRNWRPNIILFSGGAERRPYLIEFGRWLVKKRGILSSFELIENKNVPQLVRRPEPALLDKDDEFEGIFSRQVEVNDIYNGMETITKLYGFAGIEPNTVMLGWARESKDPIAFSKLLRIYQKLDYNIFILDYDQESKFGNRKTIDLWWRGSNNNANLALTLIKFLLMEDEWSNAKARIFIITNDSSIHNRVYKNVKQILEDQRLEAEVNIINNSIENKEVSEIIKIESMNSDLVILGLPDIEKDKNIIEHSDKIISELNTVLLIHASSFFKPIYIGIEDQEKIEKTLISTHDTTIKKFPEIEFPPSDILAKPLIVFAKGVETEVTNYYRNSVSKIMVYINEFVDDYRKIFEKSYNDLENEIDLKQIQKSKRNISKIINQYLFNSNKILSNYQELSLNEFDEYLQSGIQAMVLSIDKIKNNYNEEISYVVEQESGKKSKLNFLNKKQIRKINIHNLFNAASLKIKNQAVTPHLNKIGILSYRLLSEIQRIFNSTNDSFLKIQTLLERGKLEKATVSNERNRIYDKFVELKKQIDFEKNQVLNVLIDSIGKITQEKAFQIKEVKVNKIIKNEIKSLTNDITKNEYLFSLPSLITNNQKLISNFFLEDIYIKNIQHRIKIIINKYIQDIFILIDDRILDDLEKLKEFLNILKQEKSINQYERTFENGIDTTQLIENLTNDFNMAIEAIPESIQILDEESFQRLEETQFEEISILDINLKRYLHFIIENEIIEKFQDQLNKLSINVNKSIEVAQDVIRFTNYNVSQFNDQYEAEIEPVSTVIDRSFRRIEKEIKVIHSLKSDFIDKYNEIISECFEKLNPYLISKSAIEFKKSIRVLEGKEFVSSFQNRYFNIKNYFSKILVDLVYRKSEGILLAQKLNQSDYSFNTETQNALKLVNSIEPDKDVIKQLPFYYKQLFLGKHFKSSDFLIERKKEMNEAAEAFSNYSKGYKGGLLIIGDRLAGKTTISSLIANKFFHQNKIYQVDALESGSIDLKDFERQFSIALKQEDNPDNILTGLPNNSVVIFNDLELWWERSIKGDKVIDKILNLIENYSSKIFFIVNCNSVSYGLMKRIFNLENLFIKSIHCQPFDAEEIKDAVLLRHKSSGMKFIYNEEYEDQLSKFKLARLFNQYFDLTDGNIGIALHFWISNILKIKSDEIVIKRPDIISSRYLNNLSEEWKIIIEQFIYHKKLNEIRLGRILSMSSAEITSRVNSLKRAGILVEETKGIYNLNPYIHSSVTQTFIRLGII